MEYISIVIMQWSIFAAAAVSLRLFCGGTGYVSLMHAVFFGIGAYVAAILPGLLEVSSWICWIAAAAVGGTMAFPLTAPLFRTKADHFAVLTIALQMAATTVFRNSDAVTGGSLGLSVPVMWPFGVGPTVDIVVAFAALCVVLIAVWLLERSHAYKILVAMRSGEHLFLSFGYRVDLIRASFFSASAALTSLTGALFAQTIGYIDPSSFRLEESIYILTIVIIAGMRGTVSVLLAALFLVAITESLRFVQIDSAVQGNIKSIVYAVALCAAVLLRFPSSRQMPANGGRR